MRLQRIPILISLLLSFILIQCGKANKIDIKKELGYLTFIGKEESRVKDKFGEPTKESTYFVEDFHKRLVYIEDTKHVYLYVRSDTILRIKNEILLDDPDSLNHYAERMGSLLTEYKYSLLRTEITSGSFSEIFVNPKVRITIMRLDIIPPTLTLKFEKYFKSYAFGIADPLW